MSAGFVDVARKLADSIGVVGAEPLLLANMFSAGTLAEVPVGHVVCTHGSPSEKVFLLVDGVVEVEKPDMAGVLRPIALVQGPAMIGHMGAIDGSPVLSAEMTSLTPSEMLPSNTPVTMFQ